MGTKKKPMSTAEAGRKRWKGVDADERSRIMTAAVTKRWSRRKKKVKKTP
jgi:hypothetical protein